MKARPRLLVLDNRDSFTWNIVQALRAAGAATGVVDAHAVGDFSTLHIDGLVISPGPGTPDEAGRSIAAIEYFAPRIPVLGVCLGHQCLAIWRGARLVRAARIVHGKTSRVDHDGAGLFRDLPQGIEVMRYHSLIVDPASLPDTLVRTAWTAADEIMGLRCVYTGAEGVQFHPESVASAAAVPILTAFVARCAERQPARELA